MTIRHLPTLLLALLLALGAGGGALAQDDGPSPDTPTEDRDEDEREDPQDDEPLPTAPDGPLDLAAMTLDSNVLPEGYGLYAETYYDVEELAAGYEGVVEDGAIEALGIVGYYETVYLAADGAGQIRSYVIEYPDAAAAEDGFDLFEDEDLVVTVPADLEDDPGPEGIGEEPSEVTTGTYGEPGAEQTTVDVSFRVDRLGVGVAMETFDGSDPDEDLVLELAAEKEARVADVLTGEEIEGVDPDLPARVVALGDDVTFEGYQTALDGFGSLDLAVTEGFVSSYVRGATASGDPSETILPYLTVSVTSYEDDAAALAAVESSDEFVQAFAELEEVEGIDLVGGSPTVGYTFESVAVGDDLGSARVFVAVDDAMLSVDVQGYADADDALDAALEVAEAAADCASGGDCSAVGLPDDGLGRSGGDDDPTGEGTPVASPTADDETG